MDSLNKNTELAQLLRDLRQHKNLTLAALAQQIGRSVGFLSQVERGLSQPTVADLTAISEALNVPTTYFYGPSRLRAVPWVTRPSERRTVYYAEGITDILVSPVMSAGFTMLESVLAPGASSGEGKLQDRSEQGGWVLEGELTVWLEPQAQPVILYAQDGFQLAAYAEFRYANLSQQVTRVLWVYT